MADPSWTDDPLAAAPPPAVPSQPYLEALNPAQRAAVEALDGPVLVLAGAGTGKTRVLTTRLAHLLNTGRAWPSQILAVTFTNKAAGEMRARVAALTDQPIEGWWLGTFHALAARILRRHAERVGLRSSFTILDTADQLRLIKQLLDDQGIDGKRWSARLLLSVIERWKDRGLTPAALKPEDAGDVADGRLLSLYSAYQQRLTALNACDFGDLLLHNLSLMRSEPDVLDQYHHRFRYILVDEYQDSNQAQYFWLRLLAQKRKNICCVGDDDQSIYGWRGAEVGNILRFETDFPGARVIRLEQNYRSTGHILGAASGLIAHNRGRLGKTLYTTGDGGERVIVRCLLDSVEEARWIGEVLEDLQRREVPLRETAVLVRASFQLREIEERLITIGLPYRVVGGPRFYERLEIRDALAYLRVVAQPADDLAFERIVNTPKRGLGPSAVQTLFRAARAGGEPLVAAGWRLVGSDEMKPKPRASLRALLEDLERWRGAAQDTPHTELARTVLDESGYTAMWQADRSPEAKGRLENLSELITAMGEFPSLTGFLEHVSLVMESTEPAAGRDMVTLMTLHAAKGLEFDHVFLPGWEDGTFPNQRAVDETGVAGLEEERRLAYVGLTRARRRAYVSLAARRLLRGQWQDMGPSCFVEELPPGHVEIDGDAASAVAPDAMFEGSGLGRPDPSRVGVGPRPPAFRPPRPGGQGRRDRPTLEGVDYVVAERPRPTTPFASGERVFHQKFGPGTVTAVDGDKLLVAFDHAGEKKVMDSFVQRLSDAAAD